MLPQLSDKEARVVGCLIEKSIVTPDQYPITLNALTNACNQKSSREPVMALQPGEVQQTMRLLEAKHLARTDENFKSPPRNTRSASAIRVIAICSSTMASSPSSACCCYVVRKRRGNCAHAVAACIHLLTMMK